MPVKLNIGCGGDIREGYINIDPYAEEADTKMDAGKLDFGDQSVDEIFSSHMLEHMSKHEVPGVLEEWRRVLKPAGRLEVIIPDFPWCLRQWLRLPEQSRWDWALDTIYGLQDHPGEFHKTGFSVDRLEHLLGSAGFQRVRASTCFTHNMQSIRAVAYPGSAVANARPEERAAKRWLRKQFVFMWYRLMRYIT